MFYQNEPTSITNYVSVFRPFFLNSFFDKMASHNLHFLTKWLPFFLDFPWIFRGGRGSGRQISRPGSLGRAHFGINLDKFIRLGSFWDHSVVNTHLPNSKNPRNDAVSLTILSAQSYSPFIRLLISQDVGPEKAVFMPNNRHHFCHQRALRFRWEDLNHVNLDWFRARVFSFALFRDLAAESMAAPS